MRELERLRQRIAVLEADQGLSDAPSDLTDALNEARLGAVAFEAMPEIVSITRADDGRFINANQRFFDYFKLSKSGVIGKTARELRLMSDSEGRAPLVAALKKDGQVRDFPVRVPAPDGGTDHFLFSTDQIELDGVDVLVTVARRVTDEVTAKQAFIESEERFRQTLEAAPVPLMITRDGTYFYANKLALELLGWSDKELVGQSTRIAYADYADRDQASALLARDGKIDGFEVRLKRRDGSTFWALVSVTVLNYQGQTAYLNSIQDITEHRRLEAALRHSEARFQDFAEIGSDWLWEMDGELRYTYFSDRLSELTGVSTDRSLGKTRQQAVKADPEYERWRSHEMDLEARRPFRDFRYTYTRDDGRLLHWSVSGKPIFDEEGAFQGYRGTGTDVTAEVEAQLKAEDFQLRFITAVEHMPVGFALYDENDRLVHFNERYRDLTRGAVDIAQLGETFENIMRAHVARGILKNIDEDQEAWIQSRLERHRNPNDPFEISHADSIYDVREYRTPDAGTLLIMADVTERQTAEWKLRKAKEEAEFADRSKTEFLANMSHELRTPLNAIIGFSQMLVMGIHGSLNEKQREQIDYVIKSGEHLLDLIGDILDISKIEAGRAELTEEIIDVEDTIGVCVNMIRSKSDEASLQLETEVQPGLPPLRGDVRMIKQILLNLLSNAVKFTPPGGEIKILAMLDNEGLLWVDISDTGIGISNDDLPKAMSTFGQVDSAMNRSHQGTGLGLPLASSLAQLHDGGLIMDSQVDVGTTARIWFPAERLQLMDSAS